MFYKPTPKPPTCDDLSPRTLESELAFTNFCVCMRRERDIVCVCMCGVTDFINFLQILFSKNCH